MKFLKGGELFSRLAKGRFSEDLIRRYFHQLISAVEYCHSRGVFHRDRRDRARSVVHEGKEAGIGGEEEGIGGGVGGEEGECVVE
ncbi:hypothetical protein Syun_026253 [Stephania yunnanensis]|uniref:Protein kinase domain-containing protein n=1 Tax=Stephania yunnanensis TaxID=152371 RepID=A0AAP0HS05_9MAGN